MEHFLNNSSTILLVIIFLIQFKIFIRESELDTKLKEKGYMTQSDFQAQFQERRATFQEYISSTYVSKESCGNNNNHITTAITNLKDGIKEDMKTLKADLKEDMKGVQDNVEKLSNIIIRRIEQVEQNR